MNLKYINKTITLFLTLIFLAGLFPQTAYSLPNQNAGFGDIRGFNKSVLDNNFSRADRQLSPERWLEEAKLGIKQAVSAWELTANDYFDNPLLLAEAKNNLERAGNEELEKRFSQWLLGRFFGEAVENAVVKFSNTLDETSFIYTWQTDEEGNILIDETTGDPLVIRPDFKNFSDDLLSWRGEKENIININSSSLDKVIINIFPELIAFIPFESREQMSKLIYETADIKKSAVKNEFENIAAREESIFTSRRTRDIWSLRNKSENEAAHVFTANLISKTEDICNKGIQDLNERIEAAEAGAGDLILLGEEWLNIYKEQFERGLKAWEEAEERFFIRRIEWEQESFRLFSEGEEIWLAAFDQFEKERNNWEIKAKELFGNGEKLFINLSEEFNKNIENAKKEFELNMQMRIGEGKAKADALINMYLICSSAAISAKESEEFWTKNMNKTEAAKSKAMYDSYIEKAIDARERILTDYAELLGTGMLKDILSDDASSEDFCLDEYQIALVRAKALVLYWERKTEISKAVALYANELSAGRITEGEGLRALEKAKLAYNESVASYEKELEKLKLIGNDINKQSEVLNELTQKMLIEENKLKELNDEYISYITLSEVNMKLLYSEEINSRYGYFREIYKTLKLKGEDSDYWNILEAGMLWGIAEQNEAVETILNLLNNDSLSEEEKNELTIQLAILDLESQKATWQETCGLLSFLFDDYGIVYNNKIPEINGIIGAIIAKSGNFVENTVNFINRFNNCFTALPEWIENEIENWINAFIEHAAAAAFEKGYTPSRDSASLINEKNEVLYLYYQIYDSFASRNDIDEDEAEALNKTFNRIYNHIVTAHYAIQVTEAWENIFSAEKNKIKNWREYLLDDYIDEIDPALVSVSGYIQGVLADIKVKTDYYTNRINDAFYLYSTFEMYEDVDDSEYYFYLYNEAVEADSYKFNSLKNFHDQFVSIAEAYKLTGMSQKEMEIKLSKIQSDIIEQGKKYEKEKQAYFTEAEEFMNLGSLYDSQYKLSKTAYENIDIKRFEYEKQDAIQRWASTAYLNNDDIEAENCLTKLKNAQIVLEVLSDLYNKEESRSYNNPEYEALFAAYEKSFERKIKVLQAIEIISASLMEEKTKNLKILSDYNKSLMKLGSVDFNYTDYNIPESQSKWGLINIVTIKDGRLVFSRNKSMVINGVTESKTKELDKYLNENISTNDNQLNATLFQKSVYELSERMTVYLNSSEKYKQWSYAREYLILSLINNNSELKFLSDYYIGLDQLSKEGSLGKADVVHDVDFFINSYTNVYNLIKDNELIKNKSDLFKDAWNSLSETEKLDLEFYVILTLSGNDYLKGFSRMYTYDAYELAYEKVESYYKFAKNRTSWYYFGAYKEMKKVNELTLNKITTAKNKILSITNNWMTGLSNNIIEIKKYASAYAESYAKISSMDNRKTNGETVEWNDIKSSLIVTKKFDSDYISIIKNYWELFEKDNVNNYYSVFDALSALYSWADNEETNNKNALNKKWLEDSYIQATNEKSFLESVDKYIAGSIDISELKTAAEDAYGNNAASWKKHYNNMHAAAVNNLSIYLNIDNNFSSVFNTLGNETALLTEKTFQNRYTAEYSAREVEWNQTLNDLIDKYIEWKNSSAKILEKGRDDWIKSSQKLSESYNQWNVNFQNEYERVNGEWAEAYLAGLEDKERWLAQAADAVNNASSDSFLSLLGTEGERLSRFVDTREPLAIRNAAPQAHALMAELLQSSGIVNMAGALGSVQSMTGTVSVISRGSLGGGVTWDSSLIRTAASDLARKTNEEIAGCESRKLAYNAAKQAEEAVKMLSENVKSANKNLRNSMDDFFQLNGFWRKIGNNYEKEIVKGSTLVQPVITKKVKIDGYKDYEMEAVELKTNVDEKYLQSLNSIAIQGLLANLYKELETVSVNIFGKEGEEKIIDDERSQSGGRFGAHVGYQPSAKDKDIGKKRSEMFNDEGEGELGRLISEFTYWEIINSYGSAELSQAPWDKRIWNDDGSFFKSPSIRQIGTIATSVAAIVFIPGAGLGLTGTAIAAGGLSAAADFTFGTLDVAFGYKTFDEMAFSTGKSFLTGAATGLLTSGFGDITSMVVSKAAGDVGKVTMQTLMTGVQTVSTTAVSSALSGITYTSGRGFGYNEDIFYSGMSNLGINMLTSMTSTFTTSTLTAVNSGMDLSKLKGFNKLNHENINNLNNLIGSLAGEGISYAFGNDFNLNILNLGLFTDGSYQSGLLELHLGRGGASMNIGTGGANVSFDNLKSVLNGAKVWNLNNKIFKYGEDNEFDALVTLRAQYGYGDNVQKSQLNNILTGNATLKTGSGDFEAKTTRDENDKRLVTLTGYEKGMSSEDQFLLALYLGHEAYRDGYNTKDNYLETRTATQAHTEMAIKMIFAKENISLNNNIGNDLTAYLNAVNAKDMSIFNNYVDKKYDSSEDFWKLMYGNDGARFGWDGQLSFNLSEMKKYGFEYETVDLLDEDILKDIWSLGSDMEFEDFKTAMGTFVSLNNIVESLENSLLNVNDNHKKTLSTVKIRNQLNDFYSALEGIGESGLLSRTDAILANPGDGRNIFADGGGFLTCDYGIRALTWGDYGNFEKHFAWDIVNSNTNLVAPLNGSLGLNFTKEGGLNITNYGEDNQSISYGHSNGTSIRNFIGLFTNNGITMDSNGTLGGIAQNMIIGAMGNTGTYTTGAHVHLVYRVDGVEQNPASFFYEDGRSPYPSTAYAKLMSGLSTVNNVKDLNLTTSQINGIYDYFNIENEKNAAYKFMRFAKNSNSFDDFYKILFERMPK